MRMSRRAGLLAFASAVEITYSGNYTDELVTMDGSTYRLLTLTSSGTLTASAAVTGDIWICGGGGTGEAWGENGGGGGYAATSTGASFQNLVVTIGAGGVYPGYTSQDNLGVDGNSTSISGNVSLSANGGKSGKLEAGYYGDGGSGGGNGGDTYYSAVAGSGDGIAKKPFGSSYFSYPFCDGGGGGGYRSSSSSRYNGGAGGTNGGNGGARSSGGTNGGAGGGHYGGAGGAGTSTQSQATGKAATGYGSGGGGGGLYQYTTQVAGNGYQGVCFIRIPA